MYINYARRELILKIVYYGPALSGKTTNLVQIHRHVDPSHRSELLSLKTTEDRTLYFDFLELRLGKIVGLNPRVQLYTVPGQPHYEATRRLVLRGADGVVFVADSQLQRMKDNLESWIAMRNHLGSYGIQFPGLPHVVQLNKRDLPGIVSPNLFRRALGLDLDEPVVEAVAANGTGVQAPLRSILEEVVSRLRQELAA